MDRSLLLNNAGRNANATSDLNSCAHRRRLSPRGYQTAVNLRRETICSTMLTALFSLQYPLHPRTSHTSPLQVTYGDHGARPRSSHKPKTRWAVNSCQLNHRTRSRPTVRKGPDALRGRTFYSLGSASGNTDDALHHIDRLPSCFRAPDRTLSTYGASWIMDHRYVTPCQIHCNK